MCSQFFFAYWGWYLTTKIFCKKYIEKFFYYSTQNFLKFKNSVPLTRRKKIESTWKNIYFFPKSTTRVPWDMRLNWNYLIWHCDGIINLYLFLLNSFLSIRYLFIFHSWIPKRNGTYKYHYCCYMWGHTQKQKQHKISHQLSS
jgi:hypothetical protein